MVTVRGTRTERIARGRGIKRYEGVVPGSTNQRQDAIDRHVARGLVQRIPAGWRIVTCASARNRGVVVAATRKKVEVEKRSLPMVGVQTYSAHSVTLTGKPY